MLDRAASHDSTPLPIRGRVLDGAEWTAKLSGTALEGLVADPGYTQVIVVEQGQTVVACWAVMSVMHVEGLWIAPDAHAGVSRALLSTMIPVLQASGAAEVLTQSLSPAVDSLITKAGGRTVPGQTWVIPVKEL